MLREFIIYRQNLVDKIYTERGFYFPKEVLAKTCPFCQTPIFKGEAVVYCDKCHMPYHQNCWQENGCCAIPGCGHKITVSNINSQCNDKVIVEVAEVSNAQTRK